MKKNIIANALIFSMCIPLMASCTLRQHSELNMHNSLGDTELVLHPISMEFLRVVGEFDRINGYADGVEQRIGNPEELKKYVDYMRRHESTGNILLEILEPHVKSGDHLYWFDKHKEDKGYSESGVLVMRNNQIVFKHIEHTVSVATTDLETTASDEK